MRCPCSWLQRTASPALEEIPQVAGALIPDHTQHSGRDDLGMGKQLIF